MRICLFRAFPDAYRNSMEKYADRLLESIRPLLEDGHEIVDRLPSRVRLKPKLARYWDQYVRYQWLGRRAAGDVNHVIDHAYGHLVGALPASRTVVTFHDATALRLLDTPWTTRLSLRYSLRSMRRAARIIAGSQAARRDFLELVDYPEERVRVVYHGVDRCFRPLPGREALRRSHRLPAKYVLHVGHSLPYMNLDRVFLSIDRLVRRCGVDAALVKVGDRFTPEQESLLDALALRDRVVHLGRLPLETLAAVYNCADALLYPVLNAGFGWPPLEAMACGTPVVCSDRGALPEVLEDAAAFVDPEDHAAMADRLAELLTDAALRDARREQGLRQARRYTWDATARAVLEVYREVAGA